jgi:hypothetical protein
LIDRVCNAKIVPASENHHTRVHLLTLTFIHTHARVCAPFNTPAHHAAVSLILQMAGTLVLTPLNH